jgi:hypothetical protein
MKCGQAVSWQLGHSVRAHTLEELNQQFLKGKPAQPASDFITANSAAFVSTPTPGASGRAT